MKIAKNCNAKNINTNQIGEYIIGFNYGCRKELKRNQKIK